MVEIVYKYWQISLAVSFERLFPGIESKHLITHRIARYDLSTSHFFPYKIGRDTERFEFTRFSVCVSNLRLIDEFWKSIEPR